LATVGYGWLFSGDRLTEEMVGGTGFLNPLVLFCYPTEYLVASTPLLVVGCWLLVVFYNNQQPTASLFLPTG